MASNNSIRDGAGGIDLTASREKATLSSLNFSNSKGSRQLPTNLGTTIRDTMVN